MSGLALTSSHAVAHPLHHRRGQRVAALGAVHGEHEHRPVALDEQVLVGGRLVMADRSRLRVPQDPHGEVLRRAAVGVADRRADAVDLVLAGLAAHLQRGLGEPQHAGGADRVRRQHAARRVHRAASPSISVSPSSVSFHPSPAPANPRFSIHIGSYQLNGT